MKANTSSVDPVGLKRRRLSSDDNSSKFRKYNSLVPLVKNDFCENYKNEAEQLLKQNVDVDEYDPDEDGCTPLSYVVQQGSLEWTKFLLEKGADQSLATIDLDDGSKATISDLAWYEGNYHIVVYSG